MIAQPPIASIRVNVDVKNPGQFLACCGLLELADRLWPTAEGWFEESSFCIKCDGNLQTLLSILVMDPPERIVRWDCNGLAVEEIIAPLRFSFDGGSTVSLILDAWTVVRMDKQTAVVAKNPPWNFWSGQQTSSNIWSGLREALANQMASFDWSDIADIFNQRVFQKGRFGFDPGPAWNALDTGFSPNEHGINVESSAAVELLAAVGLQRFRPRLSDDRETLTYSTWSDPLPPSIAAVAACGGFQCGRSKSFCSQVVSRGQYAALGYSHHVKRGD